MTRDEAIETLEEMIKWGDPYEVDADACGMAIEALKKEPTTTVLQQIRQEIDSHGIIMQISNGEKIIGENVYIAKEIVLEIIDKHIGDTE